MAERRREVKPTWPTRLARYGFAVGIASLATALKVALAAYLVPTFILAFPAVLGAAAFGGIGPGILATLLSAGMAWLWVLSTPGDFHGLSVQEASGLGVFVAMGFLMSLMAERLKRSQGRVEHLEHERAIQAAEAKFRKYVESSPDALFVEAADGQFLDANPAGLEMLGVDLDTLRASNVADFVPAPERALVRRKFETLSTEEQIDYERRFLRPDGRVVDTHVRAVKLESGRVMAYCRDITEQRRLQEQLAMASRLAAMGTLVAGVAHEINNPLGGAIASHGFVKESADRVRAALRSGDPVDRERIACELDEIVEALGDAEAGERRVAGIVKDLTLLGRAQVGKDRVQLKGTVERALKWIPQAIRDRVEMMVELGEAPDVLGSTGQLEQVIVNLVTNALHAIPEDRRGRVTITLGLSANGGARLDVTDDGVGMNPQTMARIFDPFFSTRIVGKGMGLGLSICHAIVMAHGGKLTVESEAGKGSRFWMELPAAPASTGRRASGEKGQAGADGPASTETVNAGGSDGGSFSRS